jgi:hypothetical protein
MIMGDTDHFVGVPAGVEGEAAEVDKRHRVSAEIFL